MIKLSSYHFFSIKKELNTAFDVVPKAISGYIPPS